METFPALDSLGWLPISAEMDPRSNLFVRPIDEHTKIVKDLFRIATEINGFEMYLKVQAMMEDDPLPPWYELKYLANNQTCIIVQGDFVMNLTVYCPQLQAP